MNTNPFPRLLHYLPALLLLLALAACRKETLPEGGEVFLRSFYRAYGEAILTPGSDRGDSLLRAHCTEAFRQKLTRIGYDTGGDALIRAQDFTPHAVETIETRPLDEAGWYEVTWEWQEASPQTPPADNRVRLPVRLEYEEGAWKVAFVTPHALGEAYGDTLFYRPGEATFAVHPSNSPGEFLRSFIQTYAAIYATLQANPEKRCATLRKAWLTERGQRLFRQAAEAERAEGYAGYDLLLAGFDYDRPQIAPIRIDSLDKAAFEIYFPQRSAHLYATLTTINGSFRIDSIARSYDETPLPDKRGAHWLRRFYEAYLANDLSWEPEEQAKQRYRRINDSLEQHGLTEFMQDRVGRIWDQGRGDLVPIIIAQECDSNMLRTLQVKPMGNRWFSVRYWWDEADVLHSEPLEIAIHLNGKEGDSLRIDYFSPPGSPICYGDSAFYEHPLAIEVRQDSPEAFLRSFYRAYTMGYCCIGLADPAAYRDSLRRLYLTDRARADFEAPLDTLYDVYPGYDRLIDAYLFERTWLPNVQIEQQDSLTFTFQCPGISTIWGNGPVHLRLAATRKGYRIDVIGNDGEQAGSGTP